MAIPIIIAGIALAGSIVLAGCSTDKKQGKDSGADADTDVDVDSDIDSDTDIDADTDLDADTDMDTGTDTGQDTCTGSDTVPATPSAPAISLYSDAPCAFPASISHNEADDRLYITCGMPGALWRSAPLGSAGDWTQAGSVSGYPSNHIILDGQYAVVARSAPDGFTVVDYTDGSVAQEIDLAGLPIPDELDQPLGFSPNFPAGLYYYAEGARLFVATSNLDNIDYTEPALTTFFTGTVLYFDYQGGGIFDASSAGALATSGANPTGIAALGEASFAVLSAGPYAPSVESEAAIDIFSLPSMERQSVLLGPVTAQNSPAMPLTQGGLILIGVQGPEAKLLGVDASTAELKLERATPQVENFISNVCAYLDVAIVSDFGQFGLGSMLLFAHTSPDGWSGLPMTSVAAGSSGPAVVAGEALYQTVTANDGMSGSVWRVNMGGM